MNYFEYLKKAYGVVLLNEAAATELANSQEAGKYGFLTIILAGVAAAIGALNPAGIIAIPIQLIISFVIGYSFYHFCAKVFLHGKATGAQYSQVLSSAFIVYWIAVVPVLGIFLSLLSSLWMVVINIFVLWKVHKLSKNAAIALGLLPFIIFAGIVGFVVLWQLGIFGGAAH